MSKVKFSNNSYFKGQILIATPLLNGTCFEKSVLYICSHDDSGAMGIMVNRLIGNVSTLDILKKLKINVNLNNKGDIKVYFGGPVELSRGFVLHSGDYNNENTAVIDEEFSVTTDDNIVRDMSYGIGPKDSIFAFGYAGWGAGQLESEILTNSWINSPASKEVLFQADNSSKFDLAADMLGVDFNKYSFEAGTA